MADLNDKMSFRDTLNLPRTDFPIRPNSAENEPKLLERWAAEDLCKKTFEKNLGRQKYILHDGPPFANGNIHLGHAYNKILKDFVTKYQRMSGKHVPVTPGWDCHGLPIEFAVAKANPGASRVELKKKCREYAANWVNIQKEEFKKLGVLMNWDQPYLTMNYGYEASIMRAFADMVSKGYIDRKNKTVPWCASCQTVLASAEIEYQERKDPSVYVLFKLDSATKNKVFPAINQDVNLLVWTTTPWTLPLNRAVLLKPNAEYELLEANGKLFIVGKVLSDKLCSLMGVEKKVLASLTSDALKGAFVEHPFIESQLSPVLLDNSVLLEDGTACVHSAPGCGPEDYEVGVKNGLEIYSPLTAAGTYSDEIKPAELAGMAVTDGQIWVMKKLTENDRLFFKNSIRHDYPHCWRCRNALIFRATKQWFCDLAKNDLRNRSLTALEQIKFFPAKNRNYLKAVLENRLEWCISRQRVWGVPIVALICKNCDKAILDKELILKVAERVEKEGIEAWDTIEIFELAKDLSCKDCSSKEFRKEMDIVDVWFESGTSHFAVLEQNKALAFPADLYLEGIDQYRGWFQSSLLTSMAIEEAPAYKAVFSHGFTVDEQGRKMSKSVGNVVAPSEIIEKLGTDALRLWVSSINNEGDAVVSETLLKNVAEVYRKVRNTCRFMLSNLYDFDITKDAVEIGDMLLLDKFALEDLILFDAKVKAAYEENDFTAVFHELGNYSTSFLSSFYLDIVKDRLYVEKADGLQRRSAQTACWYILDTLTRLMAPILSFTAEAISDNYQKDKKESIHLQSFASLKKIQEELSAKSAFESILKAEAANGIIELNKVFMDIKKHGVRAKIEEIRDVVLKAIEMLREKGVVKHSLEARVKIKFDKTSEIYGAVKEIMALLKDTSQTVQDFFKEFVIVSEFDIVDNFEDEYEEEEEEVEGDEFEGVIEDAESISGMDVKVDHAQGSKCPRCWQWSIVFDKNGLCPRCQNVLSKK
ncbi:MAG: Isoleucine-tRNA ligase [candidate division TM6 bacterium GW2011_GWF2_32_72]|nr:MAG: Isoleucine-tRNA ligase [candidate division TM6 bacterium GW2011_GWF2_32_72]